MLHPRRQRLLTGILAGTLLHAAMVAAQDRSVGTETSGPEGHAHEHSHGTDHGEVEEIVVTASPLEHERDELAIPVERLERETLVDQLGTTLGDTLRNVPGVTTSGFSAGASRPVIRGQDAFRTEVLEDGLGTHDVSELSPDHAVPVNPLAARSVEIVRGPAVLRYGGGASAGVVNVIVHRAPKKPLTPRIAGEVLGGYSTNGDEFDLATLLEGGTSGNLGDLAWRVDGLRRESDDYENGAGETEPGTHTDVVSGSGGVSWFLHGHRIGLSFSRLDGEYGVPEEDEPVRIDMRTNRFHLEGDLEDPLEGLRAIRLRTVYSDYTHDEIAGGEIGQTFDNDEFEGRVEVLHDPRLRLIGAFGLHGRRQKLRSGGEAESFLAPTDTSSFAVYLFEELSLTSALHAETGVRIESTRLRGTPIAGSRRSEAFLPVSGSIGLVAEPREAWSVGATAVAGQRAPGPVELFARGPHEATGTFEIGNPRLDPETSYTGELRVEGVSGALGLETAAFATHYDGFIFGDRTGARVDERGEPGDELHELVYRARDAHFVGAEAAADVDLLDVGGGVLGIDGQMDWVRARFATGDDRNVPRIPPVRWGGGLFYRHNRGRTRIGFLRHERQHAIAPEEFRTGAFTMLEWTGRYQLPFNGDRTDIDLVLAGRNLLDEEARNAVSFRKEEILLPGRSFRLSLQVRF